ncbi:MAG: hypothetical protein LKI39_08890 [Bacteroides sp.]|jgi:hypothetical protein|nr:hypothetical protein [Bacteroides sp.]
MKAGIFFTVLLSGLSLLSCEGCSHRLKCEGHTSRLELTLGWNASGAGNQGNAINNSAARGKVRNIIVGVFKGEKVLTVQNLLNPNIGGINRVTCPLTDSFPCAGCTAVVVANVLSSSAITALKSATFRADFLAVQSSLILTTGTHQLADQPPLSGAVVDAEHGNRLTFTLAPGVTTSGLSVELSRMALQKRN